MKIEHEETNRNYVFTQKELKEKLGIIGDIKDMGLWSGLSINDKEAGEPCDKCEWGISTTQIHGSGKLGEKDEISN